MISRSGLPKVLIIMIGALFALLMIAISGDRLLDLGRRVAATPPAGIAWPAAVVLVLVVMPGLVQGLFVGYLCREREADYATLSSCVAATLLVVFLVAIFKRVEFGAEIAQVRLRVAMIGLGALFCLLFVVSARLGGHLAYTRRVRGGARDDANNAQSDE